MRIYACYEGEAYDGELSPFYPLNGQMDEASLLNFLKELYDYGVYEDDVQSHDTPKALIKGLLARDEQVIAGGLVIVAENFRLVPGCCCGLEGWVEWRDIKQDSHSPWLGHDPFAEVDTRGEKAILHSGISGENESFELSYSELSSAVDEVSLNLSQFHERLRLWLTEVDARNSEKLSQKIAEWFCIAPAKKVHS